MAQFKQKVLALADEHAIRPYLTKVTPVDRLLQFSFLRLVPSKITPNHLTVFRFAATPFIVWFLLVPNYPAAASLFLLAAFSDALDGALARTTSRITRWGILADPLADKLLIASVVIVLITRFLGWKLAFLMVCIEFLNVVSAYHRYKGRAVPAKITGKIKMFLQCVGVMFIFLYVFSNNPVWLVVAWITLVLSVVFAILSLLVYKSV
ncbi:CDP-alcohol phosphatidyltransferase family protein [Patescibacteria group bacterium]|nr:CDP-alcohol phosphatidyltransferase family protein [Patescibacteria group bacterium]